MNEEIQEILKEEVPVSDIDVLKPYLSKKGYVLGFAEIQIDNEPLGEEEVKLELQRLGIETNVIICYESEPAEDLPDDWFEDFAMKFVFVGPCKNLKEAQAKMKETSYILELYEV